ncbi:MAG: OmpW family protein [Methylophilaceae bacterium]|nr:OmpW family protein [Methylophilaceae bacterium]
MKKTLVALAVAAALVPSLAMAEAGDIVVRLRATHIAPDESSKLGVQTDATGLTSGTAAQLYGSSTAELRVDSNTIPELDLSYYITKNIAAELILALGTRHDVTVTPGAAAAKNLGSVNLLPPTLTAQWHFNPDQTFDPYVGAGVSYVRAMDNGLQAEAGLPIRISRNSFGPAIQAGFDYNLENKWLINFDVKKIWFDTKVEILESGVWKHIDQLDVDPWVVSVGFGKKF